MSGELRAPGWLARHPMVGVILFIVGVLVFGVLAYELQTHGPLMQWDVPLASRLHSMATRAPAQITELMTFGFFLGKEDVEIAGALLAIYFLYKRFWTELGMVLLGWSGGALLWIFLVHYFNRPRPEAQMGVVVTQPSFPSGHTMQAALCFGMLAYLLIPKMPSLFWKWVIGLAALLTALFIGCSRLVQGGHYLTDVLAGYAIGIAWGALVYTVLERIEFRGKL